MTSRLRSSVRALVVVLTLLTTVLRLSAAAVMPLVPPAAADAAYARFVATYGPDAFLCTAMPGRADKQGPWHDRPAPGQLPDCLVCPLCVSLRDATTVILPPLAPDLHEPVLLTAPEEFPPADDLLSRRPIASSLPRAPPAAIA